MDIYIANQTLQLLTIIDYCKSIIWHTKYCGAGDFELYVPASKYLLNVVQEGCFVYRKDNDTTMIVEKVELHTNIETGDYILISGSSAESVIGRRIVWKQTNLSGKVCECTKQLLNENLISPLDNARKIDIIQMGECASITTTMQKQITGDTLLDSVVEILSTYGLGFRLMHAIGRTTGTLYFQILKGTDRSVGNAENNPSVRFSPEFDNVFTSNYAADYTSLKNVTLVAGEGEGTARRTVTIGSTSGLSRRELFTDSRNTSSNDGEISDADYLNMLKEEGTDALSQTQVTQTFAGEIEPNTNYRYGVDYFLGDIVTFENEYGMSAKVRITGVTENLDENGYNFVLTYENV